MERKNIMVDIINTPARSESGGVGVLLAGIVFVIFALLFIFYGLPAMRGSMQTSSTGVDDNGRIVIPDEIDVNVNQPN